jgi:hypothetical protein
MPVLDIYASFDRSFVAYFVSFLFRDYDDAAA